MPKLHGLFHFRQDFFEQEPRVLIGQSVVLEAAIRSAVSASAGIDEDAHQHRNIAPGDQVIEDRRHVVLGASAILEHHDGGGILRAILCRHIDPPIAFRAFKDLALPRRHLLDRAFRHILTLAAIGMGLVHFELRTAKATIGSELVVPGQRCTV